MNKKEIVSVYSNLTDTTKFCTGIVLGISEEHLLIAHVTPKGMYDGIMLKKLENIYRVDFGGRYEEKIRRLLNNESFKNYTILNNNLMEYVLTYSKNNKLIITVEINDSNYDDVQGIVEEVADDTVLIKCVTEYGEIEGSTIICIKDITHLVCDSEDEQILKTLAKI